MAPSFITCTVVDEPSGEFAVFQQDVFSNAPPSVASFLSRMLASKAVDLMSRRAQRLSSAVTAVYALIQEGMRRGF